MVTETKLTNLTRRAFALENRMGASEMGLGARGGAGGRRPTTGDGSCGWWLVVRVLLLAAVAGWLAGWPAGPAGGGGGGGG